MGSLADRPRAVPRAQSRGTARASRAVLVIDPEQVIVPSTRDAAVILRLLDAPPAPNRGLRAALKRYRKELHGL